MTGDPIKDKTIGPDGYRPPYTHKEAVERHNWQPAELPQRDSNGQVIHPTPKTEDSKSE
ncbi:MAG: hypothetical protein ACRELF_22085 [Gemmataceae bacterium]